MQPSFPIKVFRKEKVPKRKHPDEQFRSTAIPDNAEWQPSAEKVLPSSRADWRVATMIRSEPSYRKRFIYANAQKETDVTFAQCPLPCSSGELSGICESIVDWLHEMSFLKGWEPIQLSQKEDVWLKWGADDFRTINEGEDAWVRRDPGSHPYVINGQVREVRNEFVLDANHDCNFKIEAGPRFGKNQKRASIRVTAFEGAKARDPWGVLGPRIQISEADTATIKQLAEVFIKGFDNNPGWFDWWDIQLPREKESYRKRPKFYGLPPDLDESVAATLEWEWRRTPQGKRFETESLENSHPATAKKPVNVLWGKGNQLPWSAFENSRNTVADGRQRAMRYVLEPIPCRPSLAPLFPFPSWEQDQLKAVQKTGFDNGCPQDGVRNVPRSLTNEQRRQYRGPLRDHLHEVHAKFVDMSFDLRSRSALKRDMIEKGDPTFKKMESRSSAIPVAKATPTPTQPSRTQSARPAGKDDWGEPSMWSTDALEREREETRRKAEATSRIPTPTRVPADRRWPTPETSERMPNPAPKSRPSPSPMPPARPKRDMTPAMEPVQEVDEPRQEGFRKRPHWPVQGPLGKFSVDQADTRAELQRLAAEIRPEETRTGLPKMQEAEVAPPEQPSAPVVPEDPIPARPQRVAPGRRKDAAAEEQLEADDAENNARRVSEGLQSLDAKAPPTTLPPRPERPAPGRWETQADLDAKFAAIEVRPSPESDPKKADIMVLTRGDLENRVAMASFWQPTAGFAGMVPDVECFQEVRGEQFASAETALLRAQEFFGGLHPGVADFRFQLWNTRLRKKFVQTLRLAILDITLVTGRSTERKRSMIECANMGPQGATRYECDTARPTQPSMGGTRIDPATTDPPASRRAPSPSQTRDPNEPRGRTLLRRGLVPRSRSVAPAEMKPDTGIVSTQAHIGFASAAMGSFGRENGYKLGWLDVLPLSQNQRIQAACVNVPRGKKIQFFVCFGCARYCYSCDNKPGMHCHKECRHPRCDTKQPSNELVWWESRQQFRWPWRMSNTYSARELHVDDSCSTTKDGVVWVGPRGQTNSPEERHSFFVTADFVREQCRLPWKERGPYPFVVHVSNASGTKRNVPCLQTDGRVTSGTNNHKMAFCEQQNDLRVKWAAARKAPQRLWDAAWNVEGGESPHSYGPDHPALLCKLKNCIAAEWCSYLWCTGWVSRNGRWEVCWSACRHMADEVVAY